MSLDEWVQVLLAVGTLAAVIIAVMVARRDSHKDTATGTEVRVRELARAEQEPIRDRLSLIDQRQAQAGDRLGRVENSLDKIDDSLDLVRERLASVEATTTRSMEQIVMNLLKQIHQPDPRRRHLDDLIEAFMEGTITEDEKLELKKLFVSIRNYEPKSGDPEAAVSTLGFPVYAGEQTNVAILLGTMDFVDPHRLASLGHSAHRSSSHHSQDTGDGND